MEMPGMWWPIERLTWSFYMVNAVVLVIDLLALVFILYRMLTAPSFKGFYVFHQITQGILCVALTYQIVLCAIRLIDPTFDLPEQYRDTWALKDVAICMYIASLAYMHYQLGFFCRKVPGYDIYNFLNPSYGKIMGKAGRELKKKKEEEGIVKLLKEDE